MGIVERLRSENLLGVADLIGCCREAAQEIETLRREREELRNALEPFGEIDLLESGLPADFAILVLRARAAIATVKKGEE